MAAELIFSEEVVNCNNAITVIKCNLCRILIMQSVALFY